MTPPTTPAPDSRLRAEFIDIVGAAFDESAGCQRAPSHHVNLWCYWPNSDDQPCEECRRLHDAIQRFVLVRASVSSEAPHVEHLGTLPCHTPACGYEKGMQTTGPADVMRIGRLVRLMCQRCAGNWGLSPNDLKALPPAAPAPDEDKS